MKIGEQAKIGIIGTGFIGHGLKDVIEYLPDLQVSSILTQRDLTDFPNETVYTNSTSELIENSDLVVECNGNPIYATEVIEKVLDAGLPVVTMDAELHITSGTYLMTKGLITEAEGDQPGLLAVLARELTDVGFKPLVYGNLKGFLNHNPTLEEMEYWSKVNGISLEQVTEATDGTKVQIEQALVANGLGAVIAKKGMYGFESMDIAQDARKLSEVAKDLGMPISDYLLRSPKTVQRFPAGVFVTAECEKVHAPALKYFKLGDGPYYTFIRNYHLCQFEIPHTIRQVLRGDGILLNNSLHPTASVGAIAKMELKPGTEIHQAHRAYYVRGEALSIKEFPNHVPIGLINETVIKRKLEPGQLLEFDDIEMPETDVFHAWQYTLDLIKAKVNPPAPTV